MHYKLILVILTTGATTHWRVFGGSLFAESISSDYIDLIPLGKSFGKENLLMLTIDNLISVLALCATFYGLGYVHGQHDSKAKK